MRILHIAAHMGGGIGAAYAGLGDCGQEQSILLLEPPQDAASLTRGANRSLVSKELNLHPPIEGKGIEML